MTHNFYDRKGIPVLPGDTVKVFHYIAAQRKEKRYMYKLAVEIGDRGTRGASLIKFNHLANDDSYYWMLMDGAVHEDYEIVQGYAGVKPGGDFRNRKSVLA